MQYKYQGSKAIWVCILMSYVGNKKLFNWRTSASH